MNFTDQSFSPPPLVAGIESPTDIEFFGCRETKTLKWIQDGQTHFFRELNHEVYFKLSVLYNQDLPAKKFLGSPQMPLARQVELYGYYLYGSLDQVPDYSNGELSKSENFRDKFNCESLDFTHKKISVGGAILNRRDIMIIDMIAADLPDKEIAREIGVSHPTLDYHKRRLLKKTDCATKTALLKKAMREKLVY